MGARLTGQSEDEKKQRRREYQRQWAANKRAGNKVLDFPKSDQPKKLQPAKKKKTSQDSCRRIEQLQLTIDSLSKSIEDMKNSRQMEADSLQSIVDSLASQSTMASQAHKSEVEDLKSVIVDMKKSLESKPEQEITWSLNKPLEPVNIVNYDQILSKDPEQNSKPVNKTQSTEVRGWLSYFFVLTCVASFTALTVYLQHLVYTSRGYGNYLSWAFAGAGELSLLSTAYFLRSAKGFQRFYLSTVLAVGALIVAVTVGNGAFEKITNKQAEQKLLDEAYRVKVQAFTSHNEQATVLWDRKLARLLKEESDKQETRNLYRGKTYSSADRREADSLLEKARRATDNFQDSRPALKPLPEQGFIQGTNTLSLWLQVGFQLFVFAISLGLAGLLPSLRRREK